MQKTVYFLPSALSTGCYFTSYTHADDPSRHQHTVLQCTHTCTPP